MEKEQRHLKDLESKLKDPLHKKILEWYKQQPTSSYLINNLVKMMESKKNEINKT